MGVQAKITSTIEEYLALEEQSLTRHEYHNGEILAMSGGTPKHSLIGSNTITELNLAKRKNGRKCRTYGSDARIFIDSVNHFVYPDAMIVCGKSEFSKKDKNSFTNPLLIVEVLSESTANYDRGEKFRKYRTLPSFREYVLIDQYQPVVDVLFRSDENYWKIISYIGLEKEVYINTLDCSIKMSDIYRDVEGLSEPELQLPF